MPETTQPEAPLGVVQVVHINHYLVSLEALLKTCYWFSRDYVCEVRQDAPGESTVLLKPKQQSAASSESVKEQFMAQAMDFALRERITAKTSDVRDLLLAKAFSESGVLEEQTHGVFGDILEEENPAGMFKILSDS